jgi:hypothetical protein
MVAYLPDGTRLLAGYIPSIALSVIGLVVYGIIALIGFHRSSFLFPSLRFPFSFPYRSARSPPKMGSFLLIALPCFDGVDLWRMGRKFMIILQVGLTFMTIGFVLRIILKGSPGSLGIYIITTLLLLLSVRFLHPAFGVCF